MKDEKSDLSEPGFSSGYNCVNKNNKAKISLY